MVFSLSDEVDAVWARIANATYAGNMGISARVSPQRDTNLNHMICVRMRDFTDTIEVKRVGDELRRRLGAVERRIGYKPDIYVHCNIYQKSPWNIRPTMYYN